MDIIKEQQAICDKFNIPYFASPQDLKVGISRNVETGEYPIHGLRHQPEGDTTGWYIWCGDLSKDDDFFVPLHVEHLNEWRPEILLYLGLAPGSRFLIAPGYEDVWQDADLLHI